MIQEDPQKKKTTIDLSYLDLCHLLDPSFAVIPEEENVRSMVSTPSSSYLKHLNPTLSVHLVHSI